MFFWALFLIYRTSVIPHPTHAQKGNNEPPNAGNCPLPWFRGHFPDLFLHLDEPGINKLLFDPTSYIRIPECRTSHHVTGGPTYRLFILVCGGYRTYARRRCWPVLHNLDPTARFGLSATMRILVSPVEPKFKHSGERPQNVRWRGGEEGETKKVGRGVYSKARRNIRAPSHIPAVL